MVFMVLLSPEKQEVRRDRRAFNPVWRANSELDAATNATTSGPFGAMQNAAAANNTYARKYGVTFQLGFGNEH